MSASAGDVLTLDRWRTLVSALGERSPERLVAARAELTRCEREHWDPPTTAEVPVELARALGALPPGERSPRAIARSRTIARHLAAPDPDLRRTATIARALGLSEQHARRLVSAHRKRYLTDRDVEEAR
jgi:hypothetical protein